MTAFLIATLLALLVGGALIVVWRERRQQFRAAFIAAIALFALVAAYAWWVTHGHEVTGDTDLITLTELQVREVAGSQRVTGSVRNNSKDRIVSVVPLVLQVEQCAKPDICELLHESAQTLVLSIPPGESRPFIAVFNTPRLPHDIPLQFRVDHEGPRTHKAVVR